METYSEIKELVENPDYEDHRRSTLAGLSDDMIDEPIVDLVNAFNRLPFCFTIQTCYGHFVYEGCQDPDNLKKLPSEDFAGSIEYRIAYICFCIENSTAGRGFLKVLKGITEIDPDNIQLCCAEWFWERQVNTYALQVEPDRFKRQDTAELDYAEALHVEKMRNEFYGRLREIFTSQQGDMR